MVEAPSNWWTAFLSSGRSGFTPCSATSDVVFFWVIVIAVFIAPGGVTAQSPAGAGTSSLAVRKDALFQMLLSDQNDAQKGNTTHERAVSARGSNGPNEKTRPKPDARQSGRKMFETAAVCR